jgi:hypothetical protein
MLQERIPSSYSSRIITYRKPEVLKRHRPPVIIKERTTHGKEFLRNIDPHKTTLRKIDF